MKGPPNCRSCGADRESAPQRRWACHGYCGTCYRRWANQGYPKGGPRPKPGLRAVSERAAEAMALVAAGRTTAEICRQLKITRRTLGRYRKVAANA